MKKLTKRGIIEQRLSMLKEIEGMRNLTIAEHDEKRTLEKKLIQSKRGAGSKRKGATYERKIAKIFRDVFGIELSRTPQSGGFAKKSTKADAFRGDITCLDDTVDFKLHLEAKCQSTIRLREWIKQAEDDCPDGNIPVVIFHLQGTSKEVISLRYSDFCSLVLNGEYRTPKHPTNSLVNSELQEEWRPISGYEDYLVSNLGNVMSLKNKTKRLLKPSIDSSGYYLIALLKNGRQKSFRIHKLVAEHFLENPLDLKLVNHKDGNKLNNHVHNLEFVTYSDNIIHAYNTNLRKKGENTYCAKLTDKQVMDIRLLLRKGIYTRKEISEIYKVSETTILRIDNSNNYRNPYKLFISYKDQKTWKLKDWLNQASEDCPEGHIPVVVFHKAQENKDGKRVEESNDYVALSLKDFMKLIHKEDIIVPKGE